MFDENAWFMRNGLKHALGLDVFCSSPITKMFQIWMAEVSRDMLRLGVYFRAVGIMLQIPGAAEYEGVWDTDGEIEYDEAPLLQCPD